MRPITLKTLTWATVAAAVASALWLAAVEAERGVDGRLPALTQHAFTQPREARQPAPSERSRRTDASPRNGVSGNGR